MLDELKFRYRALSVGVRLLILVTLGLFPGALTYLDEAPTLEFDLENAKSQEAAVRQSLATAQAQAKNLPAMEEKLAFTTDQLKKAEARLPSAVLVDQVVDQIGQTAKGADVEIKFFAPAGETTVKGEYPYDEVRFKVIMAGKFPSLSKWMDMVAGSNSKAYLKLWDFSRTKESDGPGQPGEEPQASTTLNSPPAGEWERANNARENYKLALSAELVYYRASVAPSPVSTQSSPEQTAPGGSAGNPMLPPTTPNAAGVGGPT